MREFLRQKPRRPAELAGGNRKFRKGFRDAPEVARKNLPATLGAVNLRANAVEFVLDPNGAVCAEPLQTAALSGSGLASMHRTGWNKVNSASSRRPCLASTAALPILPRSM